MFEECRKNMRTLRKQFIERPKNLPELRFCNVCKISTITTNTKHGITKSLLMEINQPSLKTKNYKEVKEKVAKEKSFWS